MKPFKAIHHHHDVKGGHCWGIDAGDYPCSGKIIELVEKSRLPRYPSGTTLAYKDTAGHEYYAAHLERIKAGK